jgi:hypothetical protein
MEQILTVAAFDLNAIYARIYAMPKASFPSRGNKETDFKRGLCERSYEFAD